MAFSFMIERRWYFTTPSCTTLRVYLMNCCELMFFHIFGTVNLLIPPISFCTWKKFGCGCIDMWNSMHTFIWLFRSVMQKIAESIIRQTLSSHIRPPVCLLVCHTIRHPYQQWSYGLITRADKVRGSPTFWGPRRPVRFCCCCCSLLIWLRSDDMGPPRSKLSTSPHLMCDTTAYQQPVLNENRGKSPFFELYFYHAAQSI